MTTSPSNLSPFSVFKLYLHNVAQAFDYQRQKWNEKYRFAKMFFSDTITGLAGRATAIAMHKYLYSNLILQEKGYLNSANDFYRLLNYGKNSAGQILRYTYVMMDGDWRFSETSADFMKDMMSKHVVHSGGTSEVYYAGEFQIRPIGFQGYKLVIDNGSGTYAPPSEKLSNLKRLLEENFPDMMVEALDYENSQMVQYTKSAV